MTSNNLAIEERLGEILLDSSTHYERVCQNCGHTWLGLHCPHDGYQNPCPNCNKRPVTLGIPEPYTVCGCNGTIDLDYLKQQLLNLIQEEKIKELESLLPFTNHQPHKSLKSAAHSRNHLRDDFKSLIFDRLQALKQGEKK